MELSLPKYYYDQGFSRFKSILTDNYESFTVPKNTQLVTTGEYMRDTYFIHEGILRFYITADNGDEKTELFIGPGGLFPLYSPLERRYKTERDELLVKTQTTAQLTKIPQKHIDYLINHHPDFAKAMLIQYTDFTSILLYDVINLTAQNNLTKVCNYLYQYKRILQPHGIHLTQDDIAINIGITRLTLSRCLKKLRDDHIISTSRKQITIIDWPKLAALCSSEMLTD